MRGNCWCGTGKWSAGSGGCEINPAPYNTSPTNTISYKCSPIAVPGPKPGDGESVSSNKGQRQFTNAQNRPQALSPVCAEFCTKPPHFKLKPFLLACGEHALTMKPTSAYRDPPGPAPLAGAAAGRISAIRKTPVYPATITLSHPTTASSCARVGLVFFHLATVLRLTPLTSCSTPFLTRCMLLKSGASVIGLPSLTRQKTCTTARTNTPRVSPWMSASCLSVVSFWELVPVPGSQKTKT